MVALHGARVRIEGVRIAQLDALREGGLRDMVSSKGLKDALLKLAQAKHIALPGDRSVALLRVGHDQPGPDGIQACDKILSVTKAMAVNVGGVAAC
ncbi:hypothetical protein [uncultured Stenotrophomonas sp.]|uniref:hypothetical protein n=1 Tax=uncultured Stenotrophomonas sp. TaxID=165438 RepID=UPI0025F75417|nr:hypothetical protein [uncultured Stenotrophomonas sp.]